VEKNIYILEPVPSRWPWKWALGLVLLALGLGAVVWFMA